MIDESDKISIELLTLMVGLLTEIRDLLKEDKQLRESKLPRSI